MSPPSPAAQYCGAGLENAASEQGARMSAMDMRRAMPATRLTLGTNRQRQAQIARNSSKSSRAPRRLGWKQRTNPMANTAANTNKPAGKITQVMGAVVDVQFEGDFRKF